VSSGAIQYDYLPPQLTIEAPVEGEWVGDTVTVSGTALDNVLMDSVRLRLDNGSWVDATDSTSWSYEFSGLAGGFHTVKVEAKDASGNTDVDLVFFNVDITPPEVTIESPADGSYFGQTLSMSGTATDFGETGVELAEVRIDSDGDWEEVSGTTSWSYMWDASVEPLAGYTIYVRATDKNGLVGTPSQITVTKTEWNQWGTEGNIDSGKDAHHIDVAFHNDTPYITFREYDGAIYQIYVRKWDGSDWVTLGGSLNADPTKDAADPNIAILDDGTIFTAWYETDGTRNRVWVSYWNGSVWSAPAILNRDGNFEARYPSIAVKQGVTAYVTWREKDNSWSHERTYCKYFDGSTWQWACPNNQYAIQVNTTWNKYNYDPDIAFDDETPLVVMREHVSGTNNLYVMENTSGTDWYDVGGAIVSSADDTYDHSLAVQNGKYYVAFRQTDGTADQIYVYKYDGISWSQLGTSLNIDGNRNAAWPSIAFKDGMPLDETPYVTFQEDISGVEQLYLSYWNGSTWERVTTDSLNPNPAYRCTRTNLVFNLRNPYVAFQELFTPNKVFLKYYNLP